MLYALTLMLIIFGHDFSFKNRILTSDFILGSAVQSVADVISSSSDYIIVDTPQSGTIENPIIDSDMTWEDAISGKKEEIPKEILENIKLIGLKYYSFDGKIHQGQLVIDKRLASDITIIFNIALEEKFPFQSVVPISDERFGWNDNKSMEANNTSAFNYRKLTGGKNLSKHAYGYAIDVNPYFNPYIKGDTVLPKGARYTINREGALMSDGKIVKAFKKLGWIWGGDWKSLKDYQHFEKSPVSGR